MNLSSQRITARLNQIGVPFESVSEPDHFEQVDGDISINDELSIQFCENYWSLNLWDEAEGTMTYLEEVMDGTLDDRFDKAVLKHVSKVKRAKLMKDEDGSWYLMTGDFKISPMSGGYWCINQGENLLAAWISKDEVRQFFNK